MLGGTCRVSQIRHRLGSKVMGGTEILPCRRASIQVDRFQKGVESEDRARALEQQHTTDPLDFARQAAVAGAVDLSVKGIHYLQSWSNPMQIHQSYCSIELSPVSNRAFITKFLFRLGQRRYG